MSNPVSIEHKGKSISGGALWHVKYAGELVGTVVSCFHWFMAHKVGAQGGEYAKRNSLEEAASALVGPLAVQIYFDNGNRQWWASGGGLTGLSINESIASLAECEAHGDKARIVRDV